MSRKQQINYYEETLRNLIIIIIKKVEKIEGALKIHSIKYTNEEIILLI